MLFVDCAVNIWAKIKNSFSERQGVAGAGKRTGKAQSNAIQKRKFVLCLSVVEVRYEQALGSRQQGAGGRWNLVGWHGWLCGWEGMREKHCCRREHPKRRRGSYCECTDRHPGRPGSHFSATRAIFSESLGMRFAYYELGMCSRLGTWNFIAHLCSLNVVERYKWET